MKTKFVSILISFFITIQSLFSTCYVDIDPSPIGSTVYNIAKYNPNSMSNKKKGKLGEIVAVDYYYNDLGYVALQDYFEGKGCKVQESLRDGADRGIDDIFIALTDQGRIDKRYKPIFHESKYNSGCTVRLSKTKTVCQQMSLTWLSKNIKKVIQRKNQYRCDLNFQGHTLSISRNNSCRVCHEEFKEILNWLTLKMKSGHINRTASVLCPNGQFNLYNVIDR